MSFQIPTTKQLSENNLSILESVLNQNAPANDKSFLKVLSKMEAAGHTGIYKYAAERVLQNLAITATGNDLDVIGRNYDVPRKPAESAQFTIELPAINGTVIPITVDFVGDANGVRYSVDGSVIAALGIATINITSKDLGVIGNLAISDTLTIGTPIAGAESQGAITVILNTGADQETDVNYRIRILDVIRSTTGGGNAADYRIWSQEVAGVKRAYPFAGKTLPPTAPPDRTVYIEATESIDPDGIAPGSLLNEVRTSITTDPETGLARQPLGLTDATLYIESIIRTTFFVTITDLQVDASIEAQVKSDISDALDDYFRSVSPFVDGVDPPLTRNDAITDISVSAIVNDIVRSAGGSAATIIFDTAPGSSLPRYQLNKNEKGKLGVVAYA